MASATRATSSPDRKVFSWLRLLLLYAPLLFRDVRAYGVNGGGLRTFFPHGGAFGGGGWGGGSRGGAIDSIGKGANVGGPLGLGLLRFFNGTMISGRERESSSNKLHHKQTSLQTWWEGHTKGSRGILVWLMPALISQLTVLRTVVPFFLDRLSQYMQPLSIAILLSLTPGRGLRMLQNICLVSAGIGACFMFRDTYAAGSSWLPLETREDSYAVVTGATSGLGRAFAQLLYAQGFHLILVARQEQQLKEFRQGLLATNSVETGNSGDLKEDKSSSNNSKTETPPRREREILLVPVDLSELDGPVNVLRELRRRKVDDKIDVLINNAEVGSRGAIIDTPMSYLVHVMDLNVRATVALTRLLAPRMIKRDSGARILIVGSIASAGPGPDVAVYTASKAFLASFAQSLRRELLPQGVLVTLALPGPTVSKDGTASSFARASGAGDAFIFKIPGLATSTEHAARVLYNGLRQGRDVVCPSLWNRFYIHALARILPSAAIGAIARVAWLPPPRWLPIIGKRSSRRGKAQSAAAASLSTPSSSQAQAQREKYQTAVPPPPPDASAEEKANPLLNVERKIKRWFHRFWYSPVIDYSAIKRWLAYPFRPKGQDVKVDDDNGRMPRGGVGLGEWDESAESDEGGEREEDAGEDEEGPSERGGALDGAEQEQGDETDQNQQPGEEGGGEGGEWDDSAPAEDGNAESGGGGEEERRPDDSPATDAG